MNFRKTLFLLITILGFYFAKAQELPKEQLNQYTLNHSVNYGNDTLSIKITNSLSSPLRVNFVFPILSDQKIVTDKLHLQFLKILFLKKRFLLLT
jgi:hypothetical protein